MDSYVLTIFSISLVLAFSIGAQEETMSTTIGSNSLSVKQAMIWGAFLIFLGSMFLSQNVGKTLGVSILGEGVVYTDPMMFTVLLTSIIWLLIGAFTAVPISLNQTVVGSIIGVIIVESLRINTSIRDLLNVQQVGLVLLGWVIGPLFAYLIAMGVEYIIQEKVHRKLTGIIDAEQKELYFRLFIIAFVSLNQVSTAGNQAGNAMGMIYGLGKAGQITPQTILFMSLAVSGAYVLGFVFFGKGLIVGLGKSMGNLRPSETTAIEVGASILIFITTMAGIPVSGAQILVFAILGVSKMRGEKPEENSINRMLVTWLILLPLSMVFAGIVYLIAS